MKQNRGGQAFWWVLFLALAALCAWNIYKNRSLTARLAEPTNGSFADADVAAMLYRSIVHTGRFIRWPQNLEMIGVGENEGSPGPVAGIPYLLMAFSELSCDTCRDRETRFALDLAERVGSQHVVFVTHAQSKRYIRGYMRLNGIHLPVWADLEGQFFEANQIDETPILLVCNERGEVIAGHYPIPEKPELSEPFHKWCFQFFGAWERGRGG